MRAQGLSTGCGKPVHTLAETLSAERGIYRHLTGEFKILEDETSARCGVFLVWVRELVSARKFTGSPSGTEFMHPTGLDVENCLLR